MQGDRIWSWYPVLRRGEIAQLSPAPINGIARLANDIEETLFGGDQQSGIGKNLVSRIWTPIDGPTSGSLQPADLWSSIASSADEDGAAAYSNLARHIGFSIHAAGIRLRDASDGYQAQLFSAIQDGNEHGQRFTNIPVADIHLAFHSVLSELASARDYLAMSLAHSLGAPARIDAMNRLADWLSASSRAEYGTRPVLREMLEAYDPSSATPWLYQLGEYRNTFLHRRPMASQLSSQFLRYEIVERNDISFPKIVLPLSDDDPFAPGKDALKQFINFYRQMTALARLAANHAPHEASPPHFVVTDS